MVDRVYKAGLPRLRTQLDRLREGFYRLGSTETDWITLRIEPLLKHVDSLEQLLHLKEHSREFSHLRRGVAMFHSDLVYFRSNTRELERILESEKKKTLKQRHGK